VIDSESDVNPADQLQHSRSRPSDFDPPATIRFGERPSFDPADPADPDDPHDGAAEDPDFIWSASTVTKRL
jgi:hypothetical protein